MRHAQLAVSRVYPRRGRETARCIAPLAIRPLMTFIEVAPMPIADCPLENCAEPSAGAKKVA